MNYKISLKSYLLLVLAITTGLNQLEAQQINENKGIYKLQVANVKLEVNANIGARVSSLKIENQEILYLNTENNNWGSTLWPSPQSVWSWPPPSNLDNQPFKISKGPQSIRLTSKPDTSMNLSITKTFSTNLSDTSINIQYVLLNHSANDQMFAAWEITRVPPGGFALYKNDIYTDSINWIDLNEPCLEKMKIISDAAGWQAYINLNGIVLIKLYDDITPSQTAPEEGEFELYRDFNNYVELENQGKYEHISSGDSLVWDVKWYIKKLPATIKPELNSPILSTYITNFIDRKK